MIILCLFTMVMCNRAILFKLHDQLKEIQLAGNQLLQYRTNFR